MMELLKPMSPAMQSMAPRKIAQLLAARVWPRADSSNESWVRHFHERFKYYPPSWVVEEPDCLIHGDPTIANCMHGELGGAVLIDPKPPGNGIPSKASVDRGKILQSLLGWEQHLAGDALATDTPLPEDLSDDLTLMRALFWCQIHLLRIMLREGQESYTWNWAKERMVRVQQLIDGDCT